MKSFPVLQLWGNVSKFLTDIDELHIDEALKQGLKDEVTFIDHEGPITEPFRLREDKTIEVSAAFCQMFWILCRIVVMKYDVEKVHEERRTMTCREWEERLRPVNWSEVEAYKYVSYYNNYTKIIKEIKRLLLQTRSGG